MDKLYVLVYLEVYLQCTNAFYQTDIILYWLKSSELLSELVHTFITSWICDNTPFSNLSG